MREKKSTNTAKRKSKGERNGEREGGRGVKKKQESVGWRWNGRGKQAGRGDVGVGEGGKGEEGRGTEEKRKSAPTQKVTLQKQIPNFNMAKVHRPRPLL